MFKKFILEIKNKTWFIPSYYSVLSILLSFIAIIIDHKYSYIIQNLLPSYFILKAELATTILSTLVSALLTMMAIAFSTIMVVLTTYSAQFSPRTLEDFITDKVTLRVLGIFMSGVIYSLVTLFFVKSSTASSFTFSPAIGIIMAIICLAFFTYFTHHVSKLIQVNKLISRLTFEILNVLDKLKKSHNINDKVTSEVPADIDKLYKEESITIQSLKTGNIQFIDATALLKLAHSKNIIIRVEKIIGDYVTTNSTLLTIWNFNEPIHNPNEFLQNILIGNDRRMLQDIEYGLQKIVEIALRAISPGINDPNTAIKCINQLGMILTKIGVANIESSYYYDNNDNLRLIIGYKSYEEILYKTFYQLRHYASNDVSVMMAMIDALILIAEENEDHLKNKVWNFSSYILNGFHEEVLEPLDKKYINAKIKRLASLTNNLERINYFK